MRPEDQEDGRSGADAPSDSQASPGAASASPPSVSIPNAVIGDEVAASLKPEMFEPKIRRAADDLYEQLLDAVQDYLVDNVRWNIREKLDCADRQVRYQYHRVALMEERLRILDNGICTVLSRFKSRQVSADPKANAAAFAEVPDWMLRQWLGIIRAPVSGIEAATADETRSGSAEGESPVGEAETPDE